MANFIALRNYVLELMSGGDVNRPQFNVNEVYALMERLYDGKPPVGRTTFYSWFGRNLQVTGAPTAILLECIPAFAEIFGVSEYELYHTAAILPPEIDTALSLSAAATDFRRSFSLAARALERVGLSSAGEALVIDRIMHRGLDYRITVWPIVRGTSKPIHLHSWIVLEPVEALMSRSRRALNDVDRRPEAEQREHIRYSVITDGLWRSLGLRWRMYPGPEWPYSKFPALCIEVPVEERNRRPVKNVRHTPVISPSRILAVAAPFAHGELLVALLAGALGYGTGDLRYQGFVDGALGSTEEVCNYCNEKLRDLTPQYAWCIAEKAGVLRAIKPQVVVAAEHNLLIWLTYGQFTRNLGAKVWGISQTELRSAAAAAADIAHEVNRTAPVVVVNYDESDYVTLLDKKAKHLDFNVLTDHVRLSAAEVLNLLFDYCNGPPAERWGSRFDDLRYGSDRRATVPPRNTRVQWYEPGTLNQLTHR